MNADLLNEKSVMSFQKCHCKSQVLNTKQPIPHAKDFLKNLYYLLPFLASGIVYAHSCILQAIEQTCDQHPLPNQIEVHCDSWFCGEGGGLWSVLSPHQEARMSERWFNFLSKCVWSFYHNYIISSTLVLLSKGLEYDLLFKVNVFKFRVLIWSFSWWEYMEVEMMIYF